MLRPNQESLDLFWQFVAERQNIWHRKEVLKHPYPWTDDPILQKYKFTNVYRILDTGTRYVLEKIITDERKKNPEELFFNLIVYRCFNRIETYDFIGYQSLEGWDYQKLQEQLDEYRRRGGTIFTSAFMVTAAFFAGKIPVKHHKYCRALGMIADDAIGLFQACTNAYSMQKCHERLTSYHGIGDFLAYQIMLDAMYAKILPFDEDDWCIAGVGSRRGLGYVWGSLSEEQELEAFRWTRDNQKAEFERLNLDFKFLDGKEISLSNIQNCYCEFSKYYKALNGLGRPRVLYRMR